MKEFIAQIMEVRPWFFFSNLNYKTYKTHTAIGIM